MNKKKLFDVIEEPDEVDKKTWLKMLLNTQ